MNVSATDSNDLDNFTSSQEDLVISESSSQNIVSASDTGSFADLNTKITQAEENATITLQNNYTYNFKTDLRYTAGITIGKSLTIDGQGYTIDAANTAKIFNIKARNVVLKNICFIGANSTGDGGSITWDGINGKIENSIFKDNYAPNSGTIVWNGYNGTIKSSKFINNTATANNGAINWMGDDGTIIDSVFVNNTAFEYYGAIFWSGDNGIIRKSNFTNNCALKYDGGAIGWNSTNGKIIESVFTSNSAVTTAGAIIWIGDNGTLQGSKFTSNSVVDVASAVYWTGTNGTVINSQFSNNTAGSTNPLFESKKGNIIKNTGNTIADNHVTNDLALKFLELADNTIVTLDKDYLSTSSVYINANNIVIDGANHILKGNTTGLLVILGDNVTITNLVIKDSNSSHYSPLYWIGFNGTLKNSSFDNNYRFQVRGGAITWLGDNGTIYNCNFTNNKLYSELLTGYGTTGGGAIYLNGKYCTISYSNFKSNIAQIPNGDDCYGGSIGCNGLDCEISFCNFSDNQAAAGGAINSNNNVIIHDCIFTNNAAYRFQGGALRLDNQFQGGALRLNNQFQVSNCTFIKNTAASQGSGIYFKIPYGVVEKCTFINNTAGSNSAVMGGYQLGNGVNGNVSILYCNFTGNTAKDNGGAVGLWSSGNIIDYCNFINNSAGGSGAIRIVDSATITNSYFSGNKKTDGTINSITISSSSGSYYFDNITCEDGSIVTNNATALQNRDFWISADGNGTGCNSSDLANWTYAYKNILWGHTIYFTSGTYTGIVNQTINKNINLKGLGKVIIDLNQSGRAFYLKGVNNAIIGNLTIINGYIGDGGAIYNFATRGLLIVNCTFINNAATNNGGAIYAGGSWTTYGEVLVSDCVFINNTAINNGGAIYTQFVNASNSYFINNSANFFNDIAYSGVSYISSNTFAGSYIVADNIIRLYYESAYLKVTSSNTDITVKYYNDGGYIGFDVIKANSTSTFYVDFSQWFLKSGANTLDVIFETLDSNKYVNNVPAVFEYVYTAPVIYVSPNGGGSGREGSPTYWDDALGKIVEGSTIILMEGYYYGILNQTISVPVTIKGSGDVVIDAWGNSNVFTVSADDVVIQNIHFINGNNTNTSSGLIVWSGNYGTLSDSVFSDNAGYSIYWSGNYGTISKSTFDNKQNNTIDIYLKSGNTISSFNNSFIGNYFDVAPYKFFFNSTSNVYMGIEVGDIFNISIVDNDGVVVRWFNGTSAHVRLNITDLPVGNYTLNYTSLNNNIYKNTGCVSFSILENGVIYVSPGGSGVGTWDDPTSWSNAYAQISNDGIIYFTNGVYGRLGTISKSISLVGLGNVTVDSKNANAQVFVVSASNVTINNITFINGYRTSGSHANCIYSWSGANGKLLNCLFRNNHRIITHSNVRGILYWTGSNAYVENCTFFNNTVEATKSGYEVHGLSLTFITNDMIKVVNCTFKKNTGKKNVFGEILSENKAIMYVINCTIEDNRYAVASFGTTGHVYVYGCVFKNISNSPLYIRGTTHANYNIYLYSGNWAYSSNHDDLNYWMGNRPSSVNSWLVPDFDVSYDSFGEDYKTIVTTRYLIYNKTGYVGVSNYTYPVEYTINGENSKGNTTGSVVLVNDSYIRSVLFDKEYLYIGDSLSALQNIINKAPTGTMINLTRNYHYNPLVDSKMTKGVLINKEVSINGKGYTIDGVGVSRIFNITADNIIINDVKLVNGSSDYGGSIYWGGSGGIVNNSVFYNNTASLNGSAIYAVNSLEIYNSEFLDNTANVDFTYKLNNNGFTIHFINYDNYYNAIYALVAPSTVSNVTYYYGRKQNNNVLVGPNDGFNLTVILSDKVTQKVNGTSTHVTDINGNFSVVLAPNKYYGIDVRHYTGESKFSDLSFEFAYNVTVTDLELYVPNVINKGDNLTVVALVNSSATGKVNFTVNGKSIGIRDIENGRAYLSVDPEMDVGDYELVAFYVPDSSSIFYGQRNNASFTVKYRTSPSVTVIAPETSVNNTQVTIQATTNFVIDSDAVNSVGSLQFVVRLQHFFNHTFFHENYSDTFFGHFLPHFLF